MKTRALVAVDQDPAAFAPLFAAAKARGVRVGWLDLASEVGPPAELASASDAGASKSVSARAGRTLVVKTTKGAPVLRDLLREQFLGYGIVLVRGHAGRPKLAIVGEIARLELAEGRVKSLPIDAALAELLRPRHRA